MTDHDPLTDHLPPDDRYAVVEAFIDGEPVDRGALRAALDDAAVRDHLVDALILREAIAAMTPVAWTRPRAKTRGARWLAAAAAVVVVSVSAGYFAGQRTAAAEAPQTAIETTIDLGSVPAAPAATRVVTLEPGVNWTDTPGGR